MRSFGIVSPQFWTGRTGREIQAAGADAVIVAAYLMTSPHSHMCGLYYLSKAYIVEDTGRTLKQVTKALQELSSLPSGPFAIWDEVSKYVWVPTMMRWQVGGVLKPGDKRVNGIINWYRSLPPLHFLSEFYDRYKEELPGLVRREGASKGLIGGQKDHIKILDPDLDPDLEGGAGETETPHDEFEPKRYGEFQQVLLTDEQHGKLTTVLNGNIEDFINRLDRYSQTDPRKFRKYQSHYAVILNWFDRDVKDGKVKARAAPDDLEAIEKRHREIYGDKLR